MIKVEMYVPIHPFIPREAVENCMLIDFGGCTVQRAVGSWFYQGELHKEQVDVITVFAPDTDDTRLRVESIARRYKADARQLSVLFSIDGKATFIED